jgi:signal transduction histidine kinase
LLAAIPPEPASTPVAYSAQLVAYVVAICALALAVALLTISTPSDWATLAFGAVVAAGLGLVMVRSFGGVSAPWSPTAFVQLALSLALGPAGALVTAVAASLAIAVRLRIGWFRAVLNLADCLLANIAAWEAFRVVTGFHGSRMWIALLAGVAAGAASYVVNSAVLCGAVRISVGIPLRTFLRSTVGVLPYDLTYGVAAAGFSLFYRQGGTLYLVMWLVPVVSLQGFLVMLARRTNAHAAEQERHARERVELLQEIITVAEAERAKTASDLHDGPVAHLSGLALLLGVDTNDAAQMRTTMAEVSDELRDVQRNLRTLVFQLSPHDLDKPGRLREEIAKQLRRLEESGADVQATIPETVPLGRSALELVHRVCGEALANVLRHADAAHVKLALAVEDAEVVLTIEDDGRGFSDDDVERQRADGHFGTRFLAEKAEVAHGTFTVQSEPGKGSCVRLSLPIPTAKPSP